MGCTQCKSPTKPVAPVTPPKKITTITKTKTTITITTTTTTTTTTKTTTTATTTTLPKPACEDFCSRKADAEKLGWPKVCAYASLKCASCPTCSSCEPWCTDEKQDRRK